MTKVCGSGASMAATLARNGANGYFLRRIIRYVNSTSADVTATPSCHFASGWRWKVSVNPSADMSQLSARSP